LNISYDRAREEEAILNQVYPQQNNQQDLYENSRRDALNMEIYEIGSVISPWSRHATCFDSIQSADTFQKDIVQSLLFFCFMVTILSAGESVFLLSSF
jgi:hypothetical protein